MNYKTLQELVSLAQSEEKEFWEIVVKEEAISQNTQSELVFEQMRKMYQAMKRSVDQYDPNLKSPSGMSGGDGERMRRYRMNNEPIAGDFLSKIMETAIMVAESNACMKKSLQHLRLEAVVYCLPYCSFLKQKKVFVRIGS